MVSWRRIFFQLSFLGTISVCTIIYMLFWMTARIEKMEHEKIQALITFQINAISASLRLGVEDYAFWTHAYNLVKAGDEAAVHEDLGSGATDSALFDKILIVGPQGTLQHAYDSVSGAQARQAFEDAAFQSVWLALNKTEPKDYKSVTSIVQIGDKYAFVAAAWITPDAITTMADAKLSALFGVLYLSEQMLENLLKSAQVGIISVKTHVAQGPQDVANDKVLIYDADETPIAVVSWEIQSMGVALRQELLPSILLVALSLIAICGLAVRYFRVQYLALRQADIVATTDQLTGLLNRAGLAEILKTKDISRGLENGHLAAIYLDLNDFKALNDTHGHDAGDLALRVTAERMKSAMRKSDIVVRLGGDEFLCIVNDPDPKAAALAAAERILDLASAPISLGTHDAIVTPSAGLAISTPGTRWHTLLGQSDKAMYRAKHSGTKRPVVYAKDMDKGPLGTPA